MTAEVGQRLAGRYRLDECRSRNGGVEIWRAFDELLARSVGVHLVPIEHDRAKQLVEAAQLAATITDARFVRILDAAEEDGVFYVVREWVGGSPLTAVLEAVGQMDPSDAQFMISELAEALAAAHLSGIAHLCLTPDNVIFADNGQIKVAGLGVDAAVAGVTVPEPARADARALGNILYAALTGRWPDGAAYGLAAAPRTEGALARPRQVRAGVPAALDEIVDRILNETARHNGPPLRTPAAIAAALRTHPAPNRAPRNFGAGDDTARTVARPGVPASQPAPEPAGDWGPSRGIRAARVIVGLLVLGGLALFAWLFASNVFRDVFRDDNGSPGESQSPPGSGSATDEPLAVAQFKDFDPDSDDGSENPDQLANLTDDDPDTAWSTSSYRNDPITRFKDGVGLVIDLGEARSVKTVTVSMNEGDTLLDVFVANGDTVPSDIGGFGESLLADQRSAGGSVELAFTEATDARFVLLWFKELPPTSDGEFQAKVFNVEVRS